MLRPAVRPARAALASLVPLALALALGPAAGCGPGGTTGDAGADAGRDAGAEAAAHCRTDSDCSDGVFCNGAELCAPDDLAADARGCVAPSQSACRASQTCDESNQHCVTDCSANPDADGDGHRARECGGDDCDDADFNRAPGRTEVCDARGHDEDCDTSTFGTRDGDGDGVVDALCCNTDDSGNRHCGADCNDGDPQTNPAAHERCNGLDDNCDGQTDEGLSRTYYRDGDGDGAGAAQDPGMVTCAPAAGSVLDHSDCDDTDPAVHPGAPEVCDGADNDCDGMTDEGVSATYHRDADGDGFGSSAPADAMTACAPPAGYVLSATDCDDANAARHPGAPEVCDLVPDSDCNPATHPFDADGDGHDRADCGGDDCDDAHAAAHPGAAEICDGLDDDCNGLFDGPMEDQDGDGYANSACGGNDCQDTNPEGGPFDTERCNGLDDNCDGRTDEPGPSLCPAGAGGATLACDSAAGMCVVSACTGGRLDCNGYYYDGCEVDPQTDPNHCGSCATSCGAGGTCAAGRCDAPVALAGGMGFTCALRGGGAVACWGDNSAGALGDGTGAGGGAAVTVAGVRDAVQLSAGGSTGCVRRAGGAVACWGLNAQGQTGVGFSYPSVVPAPATVSNVTASLSVAVGGSHACALMSDRTVRCWGANGSGQGGSPVGFGGPLYTPTTVSGLGGATAIALGGAASYAPTLTGSLFAWGSDDAFQLGGFEMGSYPTPAHVAIPGTVVEVASFANTACARTAEGSVYCLGDNVSGAAGLDPMFLYASSPTKIPGAEGAVQLAAGSRHNCALLPTGSVVCWGANDLGQLGDTTAMPRYTAASVSGLTDAVSIGGGEDHTCAIRATGAVVCWGSDQYGELGDARSGTFSNVPVTVTF